MERGTSKKDQIISLFTSGLTDMDELAVITDARPNYVASVLQQAGLLAGYFDLYTTTSHPMNVYSKFFAKRLGFKDEETARKSVRLIDSWYRRFERAGNRAGQHHALLMALVVFNRARWTEKPREADDFRQWLIAHLADTDLHELEEEPRALAERSEKRERALVRR